MVGRKRRREGISVARLIRERRLRRLGRARRVKMSPPGATLPCPADRLDCVFRAPRPSRLWIAELTYVATSAGLVQVVFVIDAYARRIVSRRVSNSLRTNSALDALAQVLYERVVDTLDAMIHCGNRGSLCLSIRHTRWLCDAGIEQSVGSVDDSLNSALVESIITPYKTEVTRPRISLRGLEPVHQPMNHQVWRSNSQIENGPKNSGRPQGTTTAWNS